MTRSTIIALFLLACGGDNTPGTDNTDTDRRTIVDTGLELCGNGTLDGQEACDDGNTSDDDLCSADCRSASAITMTDDRVIARLASGAGTTYDYLSASLDEIALPEPTDFAAIGDHCAVTEAGTAMSPGTNLTETDLDTCGASGFDDHVCGVTSSNGLACAGFTPEKRPAQVTYVAVGQQDDLCTLNTAGIPECTGDRSTVDPPLVPFTTMTSGTEPRFCGITEAGVWCSPDKKLVYTGTDYVEVAAGQGLYCGLQEAGTLACMVDGKPQTWNNVAHVAAFGRHVCIVTKAGVLECERFAAAR